MYIHRLDSSTSVRGFAVIVRIINNRATPQLIHPRRRKLLHVPSLAQRQRFERDHIVLVRRRVAQGGRVSPRVDHAQYRYRG